MRCPPGSHWEWYYPLKIYGHCVTNPTAPNPNENPTKGAHPSCSYGTYWYWINKSENEGKCVSDYMKNCVSYNYKFGLCNYCYSSYRIIRSIYYGQVCISADAFNYAWTIGIICAIAVIVLVGCFIMRCVRWRQRENREKKRENEGNLNTGEIIRADQYLNMKKQEDIDQRYRNINQNDDYNKRVDFEASHGSNLKEMLKKE